MDGADRRTRRTRRLIGDALVALLLERRYDRITVGEIADRADVGRSTFYAHYRDKEDVLIREFEGVLDALHGHLDREDVGPLALLPSLGLLRHVQERHTLYRALVRGSAVDTLYDAGHRRLREHAAERLAALAEGQGPPTVPLPLLADFVAGTFIGLLRWWLDQGMPQPPEEVDTIFRRLVWPAVAATLRLADAAEDARGAGPID